MSRAFGVRQSMTLAVVVMTICTLSSVAAKAEHNILLRKEYDRWDNGAIRACRVYDDSGALIGRALMRPDGSIQKTVKFDSFGDKIEEAYYDPNGNLNMGIDGWAARRWRYKDRVLRAQISFGEDGRPVEKKLYDERGRIAVRLLANDGSLSPYDDFMPKTFYDQQLVMYFKNEPVIDNEKLSVK